MLGDLGKLIVAKGFKNLPKVQKIARSGHTGSEIHFSGRLLRSSLLLVLWKKYLSLNPSTLLFLLLS